MATPPITAQPQQRQVKLSVTLHPGQQRAQDSQAKVVMVIAGTGGGKTAYAPLWALTERARIQAQAQTQAVSGIVVAPYKILRRTTMPSFLRLFETKLHMGEWESRQDGIWRFHAEFGGGFLYFCSADTPESIEGAHVHFACCDELGQRQFPEQSWQAVERRVRFHSGRILGTTTPYVLGWLKALSDQTKLPPSDPASRQDVEVITFPSIQNPKFPVQEFERARATLPPWMFRMFYMGEWDRPAGLVYSMLTDEHWINPSDLSKDWRRWPGYAGVDFGFNNPHAMVYGFLSPEDVLYVFDEYYETERTSSEHARLAPHKQKVTMAYGDPSSPEAIAEFAYQHWRMTAAPRYEVIEGLKEVFDRLMSGRLFFVRGRLTELSKELDSYVWDADHLDKAVKLHDHACLPGEISVSTPRGDVRLDSITPGDEIYTRSGIHNVEAVARTGCKPLVTLTLVDGSCLDGTGDHPIWVENRGFVRMDALRYNDTVWLRKNPVCTRRLVGNGRKRMDLFRKDIMSITRILITATTGSRTLRFLRMLIMPESIRKLGHPLRKNCLLNDWLPSGTSQQRGTNLLQAMHGIVDTAKLRGPDVQRARPSVAGAVRGTEPSSPHGRDFAPASASRHGAGRTRLISRLGNVLHARNPFAVVNTLPPGIVRGCVQGVTESSRIANVYALAVEGEHEFFANNILVSNCDALRYLAVGLKQAGHSSLPDQPHAPGRMGSWQLAPESYDPVLSSSAAALPSMHLGTRASLRTRLSGLPRRFTGGR